MVDYWTALPLGISIGVAIIAICYMASQFFSSEGLKAYAKIELGELVLSLILVVVVLSAFDAAPPYLAGALSTHGQSFGVPQAAQALHDSLEVPLQGALDSLVRDTFRLSKIISYNYNYQYGTPFMSPSFTSSPGAGASPLTLQLQTGMDTTAMNLLLVRGVGVVAVFLDYAVRLFLLPMAVLLRFIPPTRRIGGLLLGIALAVHIVFPAAVGFSLELSAPFASQFMQPVVVIDDPGTPPTRGMVCSPVVAGIYGIGEMVGPTGICSLGCIPSLLIPPEPNAVAYATCLGTPPDPAPINPGFACEGIGGMIWFLVQLGFAVAMSLVLPSSNLAATPDQISGIYYQLANGALPAVANLNLTVLLLVVIQLACTIVLARNFAQILGGEGQFYGLAKLV